MTQEMHMITIAGRFMRMKETIKVLDFDQVHTEAHAPKRMTRQNAVSPTQEQRDDATKENYAFALGEKLLAIRMAHWPSEVSVGLENDAWRQSVHLEDRAYKLMLELSRPKDVAGDVQYQMQVAFTRAMVWLEEELEKAAEAWKTKAEAYMREAADVVVREWSLPVAEAALVGSKKLQTFTNKMRTIKEQEVKRLRSQGKRIKGEMSLVKLELARKREELKHYEKRTAACKAAIEAMQAFPA
jgi:hypothetical protein